jgi:hypothetical protein
MTRAPPRALSAAWLILISKPMYPIYVSALLGADAATRSLATLALAPLYAATPFLAQRSACGARIALPLIGLADTLYATKLMGAETGTELFAVACGLLAIAGFSAREAAILTRSVSWSTSSSSSPTADMARRCRRGHPRRWQLSSLSIYTPRLRSRPSSACASQQRRNCAQGLRTRRFG